MKLWLNYNILFGTQILASSFDISILLKSFLLNILNVTVCIRDMENLNFAVWWFKFRLKSISDNNRATPKNVAHIKSGQT